MIIAIDGPAGSGKSSIARLLSKELNFYLLNSGYFYRAITYLAMDNNCLQDSNKILELAMTSNFRIDNDGFYVNDVDLTSSLHSDEVSANVATLSIIAPLRDVLNSKMRTIFDNKDVVCEGRDTTTVLFPKAEVKIYLDASVKVRAKRRYSQEVSQLGIDEIEKNIQNRDNIDKNKPVGALLQANDAIYIDSSNLTLEQVVQKIVQTVRMKQGE